MALALPGSTPSTPPGLTIDGTQYGAWTRSTISKNLDEFARTWSVEFTDRWAPNGDPWPILPGMKATFWAGAKLVDTGYVTRTNWSSSADNYRVTAEGRSATSDLVDCAPLAGDGSDQLKGLTPLKIVERICKPFGITVFDEVLDLVPVSKFNIELGESCFDVIDRLCRSRGYLPRTTPEGWLVLTKSSMFTRTVDLPESQLVTRRLEYSEENRFSEYFVYGQHPSEDRFSGKRILDQAGRDFDGIVARHRPLVVLAEAPASKESLDKQATWERNVRMGRSETVHYRVPGVLAPDGEPWDPGMLARLDDKVLRVKSTLLVKGANHTWDESGQWTDLMLTRPEAYSDEPLKGKKGSGAW